MSSLRAAALFAIALAPLIAAAGAVAGLASSPPYAQMAPLSQYLSADRQAEIDLARSAAPPAISLHATVLVFTPHGYETAEHGTNGFTCVVERSWNDPFDDAEFWNWKMRAPVCYNAPASRSVLQYTIFRTKLALAGVNKSQMFDRLQAAIAGRQLPPEERGSMAYMMSRDQYLNDGAKSWYPHVMFYAPKVDAANDGESWGADVQGSPVIFDSSHHVNPEPFTVFFVPVAHWSDGSRGPAT
jgi:hypothetical protein